MRIKSAWLISVSTRAPVAKCGALWPNRLLYITWRKLNWIMMMKAVENRTMRVCSCGRGGGGGGGVRDWNTREVEKKKRGKEKEKSSQEPIWSWLMWNQTLNSLCLKISHLSTFIPKLILSIIPFSVQLFLQWSLILKNPLTRLHKWQAKRSSHS